MPATYELESSNALVRLTVNGDVRDADLLQLQQALEQAPTLRANSRVLLDCTNVETVLASAGALRELSARSRLGASARIAVVATRDIVYGMARMAEAWHEGAAAIRIFRDRLDAEAWLLGRTRA